MRRSCHYDGWRKFNLQRSSKESGMFSVQTARNEGAEAVIVPGTAVRRRGLVTSHQLAEEVEQREAQRARWYALTALCAQHLQLHSLRARAHPRRYRRPMPRATPRGHPAASAGLLQHTRHASRTRAPTRRGVETVYLHTSAVCPARALFTKRASHQCAAVLRLDVAVPTRFELSKKLYNRAGNPKSKCEAEIS